MRDRIHVSAAYPKQDFAQWRGVQRACYRPGAILRILDAPMATTPLRDRDHQSTSVCLCVRTGVVNRATEVFAAQLCLAGGAPSDGGDIAAIQDRSVFKTCTRTI